jgi:hypothetical protein
MPKTRKSSHASAPSRKKVFFDTLLFNVFHILLRGMQNEAADEAAGSL